MYVIRIDVTTNTATGGFTYAAGTQHVFPADRCTWVQNQTATGYRVDDVGFYGLGANAAVFDTPSITGGSNNASNIVLGYIGKTGRFVAISEDH